MAKLTEAERTWPRHRPAFNAWNDDLTAFAKLIDDAAGEYWWCYDTALKYLQIRVDTRDGGFVLLDRDGNRVEPERVIAAIERWRAEMGTGKLKQPAGRAILEDRDNG